MSCFKILPYYHLILMNMEDRNVLKTVTENLFLFLFIFQYMLIKKLFFKFEVNLMDWIIKKKDISIPMYISIFSWTKKT